MAVSKKAADAVLDPVPPADINFGVDPAALPQEGDVIVQTTLPAETPNAEVLPTEPTLTPEEIAANQAAADAAFNAANESAAERIAKEESIANMSQEELNSEFGFTVPEAIGFLRDALSRSNSLFVDKMNGLLDKLEEASQL